MSQTTRAYEYWIPIIVFAVLTMADSKVSAAWFPAAYIFKAIAVTACLLIWRGPLSEIQIDRRVIVPSVALGLVVFVLWVGIDEFVSYPHIGTRSAFDPTHLFDTAWGITFLVVRLYGLVLMVPVMEELFWRSFMLRYLTDQDFHKVPLGTFSALALWDFMEILLRYLTDQDFHKVPLGTFSALALWVMVAASAVAHPEWLVAVVASLAYAFWLRKTRSLFGVIVAHASTNAFLGVYVLVTGKWQYW